MCTNAAISGYGWITLYPSYVEFLGHIILYLHFIPWLHIEIHKWLGFILKEAKNIFISHTCSPFYLHGLTLIPTWISSHIPSKVWDEITYPFLNFNGCTVEVWEWINNFTPHLIMDVIMLCMVMTQFAQDNPCNSLHDLPQTICTNYEANQLVHGCTIFYELYK